MTCWTCEQQLRQYAVHLRWRIIESIFIAACSMHDYDEDRRTGQCMQRSIWSRTCGRRIEANDRHEASRGLYATADILVILQACVRVKGGNLEYSLWTDSVDLVYICYIQCDLFDCRIFNYEIMPATLTNHLFILHSYILLAYLGCGGRF